jgi:hypothetical protein
MMDHYKRCLQGLQPLNSLDLTNAECRVFGGLERR